MIYGLFLTTFGISQSRYFLFLNIAHRPYWQTEEKLAKTLKSPYLHTL